MRVSDIEIALWVLQSAKERFQSSDAEVNSRKISNAEL